MTVEGWMLPGYTKAIRTRALNKNRGREMESEIPQKNENEFEPREDGDKTRALEPFRMTVEGALFGLKLRRI